MNPLDGNKQGRPDQCDPIDLLMKEEEVLTRAREVAQKITQRVNQVLGDTSEHSSLPTEERPPLR